MRDDSQELSSLICTCLCAVTKVCFSCAWPWFSSAMSAELILRIGSLPGFCRWLWHLCWGLCCWPFAFWHARFGVWSVIFVSRVMIWNTVIYNYIFISLINRYSCVSLRRLSESEVLNRFIVPSPFTQRCSINLRLRGSLLVGESGEHTHCHWGGQGISYKVIAISLPFASGIRLFGFQSPKIKRYLRIFVLCESHRVCPQCAWTSTQLWAYPGRHRKYQRSFVWRILCKSLETAIDNWRWTYCLWWHVSSL